MKTLSLLLLLAGTMGCGPGPETRLHDTTVIRNQIDQEFLAMSKELADLHDPKVAAIMQPHMVRIEKLSTLVEKK